MSDDSRELEVETGGGMAGGETDRRPGESSAWAV